jgi:hypothetical protein
LLESLIASAVLAIVVLAVGSAVSAGQKSSFEGQKMILASMAADDLLSELRAIPYANLPTYDGLNQPVGQLQTLSSEAYPDTYWSVGRSVTVTDAQYLEPGLGAKINGRQIIVIAFDDSRTIVQLETFVPEPAP